MGSALTEDSSEGISKYLQIGIPILILSISLVQVYLYSIIMEPVNSVDFSELPGKLLLVVSSFILIVIMQRATDARRAYVLLVLGLSMWYFGEIENIMDEFYNIDYGLAFDLENLTSIGMLIAGAGIMIYAGLLIQSQKDSARHQKETELYADLLRHDLANELQALTGYLEGALLFSEDIPSEALKLLQSAEVAGTRMVRLVQAFAHTHTPRDIELIPLLKQISADAEQAHVGLKVLIEPRSDVGMLRTYGSALLPAAIENLLRNSYEYAGPNVTVTIKVGKIEDNALIIISDNGKGIPEEKRATLFSRGISGTNRGMGLYLTRTIVRSCGGEISYILDSSGAKFRILIPIMKSK